MLFGNDVKRKAFRENGAPTFSRLCVWRGPRVDVCQKPIKNRRSVVFVAEHALGFYLAKFSSAK